MLLLDTKVPGQHKTDAFMIGNAHHRARHDFVDKLALQRIHAVLPEDVQTTSRDLLGKNGTSHDNHGEPIGDCTTEHRGQDAVRIVRQTKREHDGGQRCPHGAPQYRGHAHQAPKLRTAARQPIRKNRAQPRTNHAIAAPTPHLMSPDPSATAQMHSFTTSSVSAADSNR